MHCIVISLDFTYKSLQFEICYFYLYSQYQYFALPLLQKSTKVVSKIKRKDLNIYFL